MPLCSGSAVPLPATVDFDFGVCSHALRLHESQHTMMSGYCKLYSKAFRGLKSMKKGLCCLSCSIHHDICLFELYEDPVDVLNKVIVEQSIEEKSL